MDKVILVEDGFFKGQRVVVPCKSVVLCESVVTRVLSRNLLHAADLRVRLQRGYVVSETCDENHTCDDGCRLDY